MNKQSYPTQEGIYTVSPHSVLKWMKTMREIYQAHAKGVDWKDSLEALTKEWDELEIRDFKNWIKFYQENAHEKYKVATDYFQNGGNMIPGNVLKATLPFKQPDMTPYKTVDPELEDQEVKNRVKQKIQSLVSRLNAAERIATHPEVQVALKRCLKMSVDEWLDTLQKLKREIQLAPMRGTAQTIQDIIIKNANTASYHGFEAAGKMLLKVAQIESIDPAATTSAPTPAPAAEQVESKSSEEAINEFINNLNGVEPGEEDVAEVDDVDESELVVEAQAVPENLPPDPALTPADDLEVELPVENTTPVQQNAEIEVVDEPSGDETQDAIDTALQNVEISDIVNRLEGIARMFKNREIARQLSLVDLMMDAKGIAPFFPTLAEAMKSALESNQYCQSRIEEILSKLRGVIETPLSQQLEHDNSPVIQQQLKEQEDAEKARKEKRKADQLAEETAKAKEVVAPTAAPQINAPQELAAPAQVVPSKPAVVEPVSTNITPQV